MPKVKAKANTKKNVSLKAKDEVRAWMEQ